MHAAALLFSETGAWRSSKGGTHIASSAFWLSAHFIQVCTITAELSLLLSILKSSCTSVWFLQGMRSILLHSNHASREWQREEGRGPRSLQSFVYSGQSSSNGIKGESILCFTGMTTKPATIMSLLKSTLELYYTHHTHTTAQITSYIMRHKAVNNLIWSSRISLSTGLPSWTLPRCECICM